MLIIEYACYFKVNVRATPGHRDLLTTTRLVVPCEVYADDKFHTNNNALRVRKCSYNVKNNLKIHVVKITVMLLIVGL